MKKVLLALFHITFGAGLYYLAKYYTELETLPLTVVGMFSIAGTVLCAYGIFDVVDVISNAIKEQKDGQS